ncbi:hypothetical protein N803_11750 [Knoellia subterranea KCTC 19937]|uniref:Helicase HerA central domain-containing protein n=1 Tax=Knoellia subterranea KCTC 19937 TaxID=1385521 RepID=A0A0A0JLT0_9MICO|nr:hypothetical protein N803_11750 [Knoellia subterranea KCTC 19937]
MPFLVIDPAKRDYARLVDLVRASGQQVHHLTLRGDRPFFNPFAVPSNCDLHAHASRIVASLDATFRMEQNFPLGYLVLSRAVTAALEDADEEGRSASLTDVYRALLVEIERDDWRGEHGQNAKSALLGRLEYLTSGPLGVLLSTEKSLPWDELLAEPCVIELGGLGSSSDRNLVFALLLSGLLGSRDSGVQRPLSHVTVLEEAHRVMHRSMAGEVGTRAITEAIAELRGAGEGFVVVDQAPSELVPEVGKLTGSKLTHRLADAEERAAAAAAMGMSPGQAGDLSVLPPGRLVAFTGSASEAMVTEVTIPDAFTKSSTDASLAVTRDVPMSRVWCFDCPAPCQGRDGSLALTLADREELSGSNGLRELHGGVRRILQERMNRVPTVIEIHCASSLILANGAGRLRTARRLIRESVRLLDDLQRQLGSEGPQN